MILKMCKLLKTNISIIYMEENNVYYLIDENEKFNIIIHFFNVCGIHCKSISELNGMILYRNDIIFSNKYKDIKPLIYDLKKVLSSSVYTGLHKDAEKKQKYPLVNIIRQVLKSINCKLTPKRISDGYTLDGVKKYKRIFIIEKIENATVV